MASPAQAQNTMVWVWCQSESAKEKAFRHPAALPFDDEVAAKACFLENQRGPKIARISPATIVHRDRSAPMVMIAQKGVTREVHRNMILPWYEGLLILQELETAKEQNGAIKADWLDAELQAILVKERNKYGVGRLSAAIYTEKRLINVSVTGASFVDAEQKEWNFRRDHVNNEDRSKLVDGEDGNNLYGIKDIIGYLPPWEAFQNSKCGFYQDFYMVHWDQPYSMVDYSSVENGGASTGATWEPDECIPAHLDPLRIAVKKAWVKKKRDREAEEKAKAAAVKRKSGGGDLSVANGSPTNGQTKSLKDEAVPPPPAKMARVRRDGEKLERDMLDSKVGHDFVPGLMEQTLGQIRSGWPKQPQDYPKGYAVASPPGFCWADCDCMDDQRPQKSWETRKAWLEDPARSSAALGAINMFSNQTRFVRRRGQVTKMCFFETAQMAMLDQTHNKAALELGHTIERAIQTVLQHIPVNALMNESDKVRIPARAFLSDDYDYEPMRCEASLANGGGPIPQWINLDPDSGWISANRAPSPSELPLQLRVDFAHAEGKIANGTCSVVPETTQSSWLMVTVPIAQRFHEPARCPLEKGVRNAIHEHFAEVYDFNKRISRERPLGVWLQTMGCIMRLLRSAGGSSLAFAPGNPAL